MTDERRVHPRFAVNLMVTLQSGATVELAAENLSMGGLFVACEEPPAAEGDQVSVSLKVPSPDGGEPTPLSMPCTVMHVVPPIGMGLQFELADQEARSALAAYLAQLSKVQQALG